MEMQENFVMQLSGTVFSRIIEHIMLHLPTMLKKYNVLFSST